MFQTIFAVAIGKDATHKKVFYSA